MEDDFVDEVVKIEIALIELSFVALFLCGYVQLDLAQKGRVVLFFFVSEWGERDQKKDQQKGPDFATFFDYECELMFGFAQMDLRVLEKVVPLFPRVKLDLLVL